MTPWPGNRYRVVLSRTNGNTDAVETMTKRMALKYGRRWYERLEGSLVVVIRQGRRPRVVKSWDNLLR